MGQTIKDLLFHPAFQSLVFPGVLCFFGFGMLALAVPTIGRRWCAVVAVLALAASMFLLPGWHWPATSAAQKLPWIFAGGVGLALGVEAARGPAWAHWCAAALWWALASPWLASAWFATPAAVGTALAGAAVLAGVTALSAAPRASSDSSGYARRTTLRGATAAATLAVASLGLAAVVAFGGSLLLAQLAAAVATVSGMLAAWGLWSGLHREDDARSDRRAVTAGLVSLMPLALAWLVIAQVAILSGVGTARVGVLGLAFLLPLLLARWGAGTPAGNHAGAWSLLTAALAAAVPAAAAVVWQATAPAASGADIPSGVYEPYYEPRWK